MIFRGEFFNTADAKWRASVPKEFRDALSAAGEDGLVLTRNRERGLAAYVPSDWERFVQKIEQHPNPVERTQMSRVYIAPSTPVKFDSQGRIPIPRSLRLWAGLGEEERDLVLVGNLRRIDIFSQSRHAEVLGTALDGLHQNPDLLAELDLP